MVKFYNYEDDNITLGDAIWEGLTERDWIKNGLMGGSKYDVVWIDGKRRYIRRAEGKETNWPICELYENKKFVGLAIMEDAIKFLYNENYELF